MLQALLRTSDAEAVERHLFAPGQTLHAPHLLDLEGAQVIVLSNNDGCSVARPAEAKASVTEGEYRSVK